VTDAPHVVVEGTVADGWADIADVFGRGLAVSGGSARLVVQVGGVLVADLRVGAPGRFLLFSASKLVTAIALHDAHAAGAFDLDRPLAAVWPALDRSSTRRITARTVLAHRSGIARVDRPVPYAELIGGGLPAILGRQDPEWEPGTAHGYHAVTFGVLLGEAWKRTTGRPLSDLVLETADRVGSDVRLGPTDAETAAILPMGIAPWAAITGTGIGGPSSPDFGLAPFGDDPERYNTAAFAQADLASLAMSGTADGLVRLVSAVLDGRLGGPEAPARLGSDASRGLDRVLGVTTAFGEGSQRPFPRLPGLGPRSFGHEGANGTVVHADPETDTVVAFTTDRYSAVHGGAATAGAVLAAVRLLLPLTRP
jgi:CubicO group peptidase (beta-lactamase class C family)